MLHSAKEKTFWYQAAQTLSPGDLIPAHFNPIRPDVRPRRLLGVDYKATNFQT